MTTPIGGISVFLEDDTQRFQSGIRQMGQLVDQQANRMAASLGKAAQSSDRLNSATSRFDATAFRILAVEALKAENGMKGVQSAAFALQAALTGGISALAVQKLAAYADTYTTISNKIKSVISDTNVQVQTQQRLFDLAQRTRGSFETSATLYNRIASTTPQLANNQGDLLRVIQTVKESFAIAGSTTEEAASVATQLSQALGSGRLQGDELRSILENNIPLAQTLAKALAGGNVGALRQMGTEGLLTTDKVIDAILKGSNDIDEAFARTTPRISDGFLSIDNALIKFIGEADKSTGASATLARALIGIGDNFDQIGGAATYFGTAMAAMFAGRLLGGGARSLAAPFQAAREEAQAAVAAAEQARNLQEGRVVDAFSRTRSLQTAARSNPEMFADRGALTDRDRISSAMTKSQKAVEDASLRQQETAQKLANITADTGARGIKAAESEAKARLAAAQAIDVQAQAEARLAAVTIESEAAIAAAQKKSADAKAFQQVVTGKAATLPTGAAMLKDAQKEVTSAEKDLVKTVNASAKNVEDAQRNLERAVAGSGAAGGRLDAASDRVAALQTGANANAGALRQKLNQDQAKNTAEIIRATRDNALNQQLRDANEQRIAQTAEAGSAGLISNALRQQGAAVKELASVQGVLDEATNKNRLSMTAWAGVVNTTKGIFNGLVSALGGGWVAALTGAGIAFSLFEIYQARTAARFEDFKKAADDAAASVRELNKAIANQSSPSLPLAESQKVVERLRAGNEENSRKLSLEAASRQQRLVTDTDSGSSLLLDTPLNAVIKKVLDLGDASKATVSDIRSVVEALQQFRGKDAEESKQVEQMLAYAQAVLNARTALTQLEIARNAAKPATDAREVLTQAPNRLNMDERPFSDAQIKLAGNQMQIAGQVVDAEGDKVMAQVKAKIVEMKASFQAAIDQGAPPSSMPSDATINAAALRIIQAGAFDASKAFDTAVQAQHDFAVALANNTQNLPIASAALANLGVTITDVLDSRVRQVLPGLYQLSNAAGLKGLDTSGFNALVQQLLKSQQQGTLTQQQFDALMQKIRELSGANLNMDGVIGPLMAAISAARGLVGALAVAKGAISSANGFVTGASKAAEAEQGTSAADKVAQQADTNRKTQDAQLRDQIRIAKLTGAAKNAATLRESNPDASQALINELAAAQDTKKGKGNSKEQSFEDRVARLTEEGRASFFSDSDRALITELKNLKSDPKLAKQTTDAILAGQPIPEKAQQIQTALDLKKAGDETRSIIDKYGDLAQVQDKVTQYQAKLNIAMQEYVTTGGKAGITTQQGALALADYKAKFTEFSYITTTSDAIGTFVEKGITDFKNLGSAAEQLKNTMLKMIVDISIVDPLKNWLKTALAGLGPMGGGGGAGAGAGLGSWVASLFGGGGGGGAGANPGFALPGIRAHSGALVGSSGEPIMISSHLMANAPRFHSGLRSDEMAAILQKDEVVLNKSQQASMAGMMAGSPQAPHSQMVVINGAPAGTETRTDPNTGRVDVDLPLNQMEDRSMKRASRGIGSFGILKQQIPRNG